MKSLIDEMISELNNERLKWQEKFTALGIKHESTTLWFMSGFDKALDAIWRYKKNNLDENGKEIRA